MSLRIGLFGGSFNPLHYGHLLLAETARVQAQLERILFIPCFLPPHKNHRECVAAATRVTLLRRGIRNNPAFSVDTWEVRQGRVVYTCETLAYFRKRYPHRELFFLVGSDTLHDIPHWRNYPRFLSTCRFLVAPRSDFPLRSLPLRLRRRTTLLTMPALDISAGLIRGYCRRGQSLRYLVPPAVERYLIKRGVYRDR